MVVLEQNILQNGTNALSKIYTAKIRLSMYGYAFRHASMYQAETWHGGGEGNGSQGLRAYFRCDLSKVNQRSCCLRNALWPPNLVGKTPDRSVMHSWGQRLCMGQLGSIRGQIAQNALWQLNLVKCRCR